MNKQTHHKDSGMVAIVVTVIIMLIITLIVITFAKISRRNQRQSLDQQLHTQALYAAESGINDAIDELKNPLSPHRTTEKDNCNQLTKTGGGFYNNVLDGGASSYSCLLIDPTPLSVEYGNIGKGESKIVPIQLDSGGNVDKLTIHWQDPDENEDFSGCPVTVTEFPSSWDSDNCGPGILRIDLVKTGTSSFTRDFLLDNTFTAFLVPPQNGGSGSMPTPSFSTALGFGGQGVVIAARCIVPNSPTQPKHCSTQIINMDSERFYIRMTALYKAATVTMCTPSCGANTTLAFKSGAQAKIDSTGKVSDILRRIQVFVSTSDLDGPFPGYAIESSQTLCKRFSVAPPSTVSSGAGPECDPLSP